MTGCFGAVDNADAQDDTVQNTSETIVNNYYNNTTTVIETPTIEKFAVGGMLDATLKQVDSTVLHDVYTLNTTAGELVRIHHVASDGSGWSVPRIDSVCENGGNNSVLPGDNFQLQPHYLYGPFTNCTHTVVVWGYESEYAEIGWSLVYSIESVTVV